MCSHGIIVLLSVTHDLKLHVSSNGTDFVQPNVPCIIKNAILSKDGGVARPLVLTLDKIINHIGIDATLTVDVTPDGHGDCIRSVVDTSDENSFQKPIRMFVKPHEERMDIEKFRYLLRKGQRHDGGRHNESDNAGKLDASGLRELHLHENPNMVKSHQTDTDQSIDENFFDDGQDTPVVYYSRQVRFNT